MLKIEFSTENAAFDESPAEVTARILRDIATKIETTSHGGGPVYDGNGNRIGVWTLSIRDRESDA